MQSREYELGTKHLLHAEAATRSLREGDKVAVHPRIMVFQPPLREEPQWFWEYVGLGMHVVNGHAHGRL
jgi:hypothetical protein